MSNYAKQVIAEAQKTLLFTLHTFRDSTQWFRIYTTLGPQ